MEPIDVFRVITSLVFWLEERWRALEYKDYKLHAAIAIIWLPGMGM